MNFYSKTLFLDQFTPVSIYEKVRNLYKKEIAFLFESTINSSSNGNFSYIIIGVRERIWYKDNICYFLAQNGQIDIVENNPLRFLQKYYKNFDKEVYKNKALELGIGLIDGFIGNIAYDIGKEFEPKLKASMQNLKDELDIPDFDLIRPNIILAYSHKTSKLVILTSVEKYKNDLESIENELLKPYSYTLLKKAQILDEGKFEHSKDELFSILENSKEMIKSGEIFQILISNRFVQSAIVDHFSFYRALRSKNPSKYLYFLEFENFSIAGSSPESMVRLNNGHIFLSPIAGSRKRGLTLQEDLKLEKELLDDEKEKAEHLMLVDLGRNDIGRVAKSGSVKVTDFMRVERYSHIMHIVSDIEALLDEKYDMFDLFMAVFTAGTMTGTPKIRAMELIAQFEKLKRSFYSGSVAYFGFDGNMDSAITIRTTMLTKDKVIFQAGAGIVADSKNEYEYLEIQSKLAANITTLKDLS